jgi:hypothetical protein
MMSKGLFAACAGIAFLALAGGALAGIPCASTSSVTATGNGICTPDAAVCPQGDFDVVNVDVNVQDCYGTPLAAKTVTVYPDPMATSFCWCPGEDSQQSTTDLNGNASVSFAAFGGCGNLGFYADVDGVTLGPSTVVYIASPDNNGDCVVNLTDFIGFAGVYFTADRCSDYNCDGTVNLTDFITFAGHYFHACP